MTRSLEDYLKTIYLLIDQKKVARVKDIAQNLNVKKPSVINAIHELKERGLVTHEKYGYTQLTDDGEKQAKIIYERNKLLKLFLTNVLGVSEANAENDACQMEHILSDETLNRIRKFMSSR